MNKRVILSVGIGVLLIFAFLSKEKAEKQNVVKETDIESALFSKGIRVEDVLITNGSELMKAFNISDLSPKYKIALIMFSTPHTSISEGVGEEYARIIYTVLEIDPTIDAVAALAVNFVGSSKKPKLVYANRTYANELKAQNLPEIQQYNKFAHIYFDPNILFGPEKLIALLADANITKVSIINSSYVKDRLNLSVSGDPIAFITLSSANEVDEINVMLVAFGVDQSINTVMVSTADIDNPKEGFVVYTDRKTLEQLNFENITIQELLKSFKVYEFDFTQ